MHHLSTISCGTALPKGGAELLSTQIGLMRQGAIGGGSDASGSRRNFCRRAPSGRLVAATVSRHKTQLRGAVVTPKIEAQLCSSEKCRHSCSNVAQERTQG